MENQVLTLSFGKSGTLLLNTIVKLIQKENDVFTSFNRMTGLYEVIDVICDEYIHGPFMTDWEQIEYYNGEFLLVFPHPNLAFIHVDLDLLFQNSSLITSHTEPYEFKINSTLFNERKVIYIYRDIRDIIVSWAHFTVKPTLQKRWPHFKHKNLETLLEDMEGRN